MAAAKGIREQKSHPALDRLKVGKLYHVVDKDGDVIDVVKLLGIIQKKGCLAVRVLSLFLRTKLVQVKPCYCERKFVFQPESGSRGGAWHEEHFVWLMGQEISETPLQLDPIQDRIKELQD